MYYPSYKVIRHFLKMLKLYRENPQVIFVKLNFNYSLKKSHIAISSCVKHNRIQQQQFIDLKNAYEPVHDILDAQRRQRQACACTQSHLHISFNAPIHRYLLFD